MFSSDLRNVEIINGAITKCNYELCVKVVNRYNTSFLVIHDTLKRVSKFACEIFTVANMDLTVFWNEMRCILIDI
jgi:hypothetical protein